MAANEQEASTLIKQQINNKYTVGQYITGGAFGSLHMGINNQTKEKVAIKLEKHSIAQPQLALEYGFYRTLGHTRFLPVIHYFGRLDEYNALVMQLLGPSLATMHQRLNRQFPLISVVHLSIQLLKIIQYFHDRGLIYRDTKPENFIFGLSGGEDWWRLHLIDLGVCKQYMDENYQHIAFANGKPIIGTRRYISVNNHKNAEVSRRDDLEAIVYMIVFLHKGKLPWQGITAPVIQETYRKIGEMKEKIKGSELCSEMPNVFALLYQHSITLQFEERPSYEYFVKELSKILCESGSDYDTPMLGFDQLHSVVENPV